MDVLLNYNVYVPATVLSSFLILFLWLFEISFLLLFSSLVAFSIGFLICRVLLQNPQYCIWLQHVFANIIYEDKELVEDMKEKLEVDNEHLLKNLNDSKETEEPTIRPWDRLKLDENFNNELDEFFKTLVINYVNSWYNENLSEDESFTSEIRQLIRHSSAKILTTFMEADVLQIFTDEIIPVIIAHVERVVRILNEFSSERFFSFEIQSVSLIELKILEQWPPDSHFATLSQENQLDYLRALSDSLICKFVDDIRIGGCFVDEEHQKMLNREGAIPFSTKVFLIFWSLEWFGAWFYSRFLVIFS
ncbi:unnamed protein product [Meloidogyne enterolobii]|uniref:Uncharacterized protein n=1 Tax=Meloidogyne enterolobii TaxID=390850 RepID=A0ACB1A8D0_MELEN